jgi:vanillate O-demethylase ferredoxin subunit
MADATMTVTVNAIIEEAVGIKVFEFVKDNGGLLPFFTAGSHIDVATPAGILRQYSLCGDPRDSYRYQVAVLDEPQSRGGSASMHREVQVGGTIEVSRPRNNFPLDEDANSHLLIAGGIGITPMLAMLRRLDALGADYHLHYCTREPELTAFREVLQSEPFVSRVSFHFDGGVPANGLDVKATLRDITAGRHVYCCGPTGLMAAVKDASDHWPQAQIHFEFFSANAETLNAAGEEFEIEIASTGAVLLVPADKSILDVLRENDLDVATACEEGVCGTCATGLLAGEAEHRDMVLSDEEKDNNTFITVCCSRAKSGRLKLDL